MILIFSIIYSMALDEYQNKYQNRYQKIFFYISVFFTGAVVLVTEILGTRILAPYFGSTIFVWSSLITVTMGALALAYYFGGKIIDRHPHPKVFFTIILMAGFFLTFIMKVDQWVLPYCDGFGLRFGPLAASAILFSVPLLLLGMASPMIIRLISEDRQTAGSSAGRVFAIGTIGSIVGALASGFFLLPYFTLSTIFLLAGIVLIVIAGIGFFTVKPALIGFLLIIITVFLPAYKYSNSNTDFKIIHQEQSFYGNIKVVDRISTRCLNVDGASESCIDQNSGEGGFSYIQEMGRIVQARPQDENILMLGLGGGGLVRYFAANQNIDIVEIDPRIVDVAKKYFGFAPSANKSIFTDDARHFLKAHDKKYNLVAMDVFASSSVPTHLVTKDFFELLRERLSSNGLVVINLVGIANPPDQYTSSFIKTLQSVFPSVTVTAENDNLANLVIQAGEVGSVVVNQSSSFKTVPINTAGSDIFTDTKNSADLLAVLLLETYWKNLDRNDLSFAN